MSFEQGAKEEGINNIVTLSDDEINKHPHYLEVTMSLGCGQTTANTDASGLAADVAQFAQENDQSVVGYYRHPEHGTPHVIMTAGDDPSALSNKMSEDRFYGDLFPQLDPSAEEVIKIRDGVIESLGPEQVNREDVLRYVRDIANGLRDKQDDFNLNDHTVRFIYDALDVLGYGSDEHGTMSGRLNQFYSDGHTAKKDDPRNITSTSEIHEGDLKALALALLEKAEDALCEKNYSFADEFGYAVHRAVPIAHDLKVAGVFKNIDGLSNLVKEIKQSGQSPQSHHGCD